MALQLGQGGRIRSINAISGKLVGTQTHYVSLYFAKNASNAYFPANASSTLSDLSDWEILAPGTEAYTRQPLVMADATGMVAGLYGEAANTTTLVFSVPIEWTDPRSTPLRFEVSDANPIGYMVISTQESSQSVNLNDIIAFGPLLKPVTTIGVGEQITIPVGALQIRQS